MAVLVTGGAGYIGSHMALALRDAGEPVVVLDDLSSGFREAAPEGVRLIVGDVADAALVKRLVATYEIDAVAHFAARISAPDSVRDPLGAYAANTEKTRMLLAALVETGVRKFIYSSTAAVYGLAPETPTVETAFAAPASPYGASKLMSEWILRDVCAAYGMSHIILRYFNVAGADWRLRAGQRSPTASNLITVAVRAALGLNEGLQIFGTDLPTRDGTGVRDYVHVSDLVEAHIAALKHLRSGGGSATLNCGYGSGYSVREVIEAVKRQADCDFPVIGRPRREGDPYVSIADATKIRDVLGWTPQREALDLIVGDALRWEKHWRIDQARAPHRARTRA